MASTYPNPANSAQPLLDSAMTSRAAANWRNTLGRFIADNSTLMVLVLLLIVGGLTAQHFLSAGNLFNIWRQMSVVAILGLGMTLVILVGGIDLSVGSVLFLSAGTVAAMLQNGVPTPVAIVIALIGGVAVGVINGLLIEIAGISPVIATLGTQIGIRGLTLVLMHNAQIPVNDPFFVGVAVTRTPGIPSIQLPGLQLTVILVFVLYVIVAVFMRRTTYGRYVYAVGGNQRAAYLCGVPVRQVKILAYVLCGFFAALAGLFMAAAQGVIGPGIGAGLEFYAVAAAVLGGTRLSGGIGRIEKTLLGAMLLYMVLNYMTIGHIDTIWQQTATGLLVLAAVVLDRLARRGRD